MPRAAADEQTSSLCVDTTMDTTTADRLAAPTNVPTDTAHITKIWKFVSAPPRTSLTLVALDPPARWG
jgi:hypothetical protein